MRASPTPVRIQSSGHTKWQPGAPEPGRARGGRGTACSAAMWQPTSGGASWQHSAGMVPKPANV
eukprot:13405914-Alexandrium_andersonii.AAC.1